MISTVHFFDDRHGLVADVRDDGAGRYLAHVTGDPLPTSYMSLADALLYVEGRTRS